MSGSEYWFGMNASAEAELQEDVARRVFQQLLDALDYCHKRSIFHRLFTVPPISPFTSSICSRVATSPGRQAPKHQPGEINACWKIS